MFIAENENKERIEPEEVVEGAKYFCPCCGGEVIPKRGEIMTWHFAHRSNKDCDKWYEMTAWHKEWQEQFPKQFREIPMERDGEKHRADIKIDDLVIEFQHSPMSAEEFKKRNDFYSKDGVLVWLFDVSDKVEHKHQREYNARKFINNKNFKLKPNIFVFMQDKSKKIYQITPTEQYLRKEEYSEKEFIEKVRKIYRCTQTLKEIKNTNTVNIPLNERDLTGYKLRDYTFNNCNFKKADLSSSIFIDCKFNNCTFTSTKLNFVVFNHCNFTDCNFKYIDSGLELKSINGHFNNCSFFKFKLPISLLYGKLNSCNFKETKVRKIEDTVINGCKFEFNNWWRITLTKCKIKNSFFRKNYMVNSNIAISEIEGCTFQEVNLKNSIFTEEFKEKNCFVNSDLTQEKREYIKVGNGIIEIPKEKAPWDEEEPWDEEKAKKGCTKEEWEEMEQINEMLEELQKKYPKAPFEELWVMIENTLDV